MVFRRTHGGRVARALCEAARPRFPGETAVSFPLHAYLAALLGAFFTTLVALPWWRRWCLRVGLVDDPGHRKIHDAPVPLAGGLAVLTGLAAPLAAGAIAVKFDLLGTNAA